MKHKSIGLTFLILVQTSGLLGQNRDYNTAIKRVQEAQNKLSENKSQVFNFTQKKESFGHLAEPWQTYVYEIAGSYCIRSGAKALYISDSMLSRGKYYHSKQFYSTDSLFKIAYGKSTAAKVTTEDAKNYINTAALFSPAFYLNDFLNADANAFSYKKGDTIVYQKKNGNIIRLLIKSHQLSAIHISYAHELYGDVTKKITYSEYRRIPGTEAYYPAVVIEEELGILCNKMSISYDDTEMEIEKLQFDIPEDYTLLKPQVPEPEIVYQKLNDHLHLLDFQHTDDRILMVEFSDFLLVAEAPMNTENGQLIIEKAKEIAPDKPLRYFVFGHHHPHYIGGIRAFVANETRILCYKDNIDYARQIISFKHGIKPDVLENNRKEAVFEIIDSVKVIKDKDMEMQIIHIGEMSAHTKDYLIYYFPKYKLLFEDDLVWIAEDKPLEAASGRQKGLYDAIIKYHLEVDTIVQSWPVKDYGVKTMIDFKDLEKSVELIGKE